MADRSKYNRQRLTAKLDITKLADSVPTTLNSLNKYKIREIISQLKHSYGLFRDAQNVLETIPEEPTPSTDSSVVFDKYLDTISLLEERLEVIESSNVTATPSLQFDPNSSLTSQSMARQRTVNLPRIQLKPFSGLVTEYNSFIETFDTIIGSDTTLSDLENSFTSKVF